MDKEAVGKYRKKPVVVEAMQLPSDSAGFWEVYHWMRDDVAEWDDQPFRIRIRTLEGEMWAAEGDWIIKGVQGEFYPCKPDIFAATYEPAQQPAAQAAGLTDDEIERLISRFIGNVAPGLRNDCRALVLEVLSRAAPSVELRQKLHRFLNVAAGEGLQLDGVDADDLYIALFPVEYARTVASLDGNSAPQPSAQQADSNAGEVERMLDADEQAAEEALGPFNTADEAIAALRTEEARGVDGGLMEAIRRYAFLFALHTQNNTDASRAEADAALARVRALLAAPAAGTGQESDMPAVCDGKEQAAFEAWAKGERYDMSQHPLHYLFLNERTYAARQGWKAAIEYCARTAPQAATGAQELIALLREARGVVEQQWDESNTAADHDLLQRIDAALAASKEGA